MIAHTAPGTRSQGWTAATPGPTPLQLWQVPAFFIGLLAFLVVAAVMAVRPARAVRELERDLAHVRQRLAQPHERPENLVDLAESLVDRVAILPARAGEAHFLLGSVYERLAAQGLPDRTKELRANALVHLQQAEKLGVPAADLPRLEYQLGTLLYQGGDLRRAIEYLNRSLPQGGADDPAAGYAMLVTAQLHLQPPDLEGALRANQKQLEVTASEEATAPVRLLRAEILFNKGMRLEAIKVLERIGPAAPPAVRHRARLLQARCCLQEELWAKAVPLWKEVLSNPLATPAQRARTLFVLGRCYRKLDPPDEAGAAVAWQEAAQAGGDEGQAAALSLAELRLAGPDPAAALEAFKRGLEKVTTAANFQNSLIDLPQVRESFEQGCRTFCEARDFERAQQLAELYKKVAPPGRAEECYAEISAAWAKDLQDQALKAGSGGAEALQIQARARSCQAGAAYEQALAGRTPAEQAELLWRSADCFAQGQDAPRALSVLEAFVRLPVPPERLAEGWFALAEAHRTLGHADDARQAYYKSIEFPTSPVASRARYQLALAMLNQKDPGKIDQKEFDQAEAILRQNLRAAGSAPDREAHEKSLYLLGNLLFQRADYLKASVLLKEATRQYPRNADVHLAQAHLGACYRALAQEEGKRLKSPEEFGGAQAYLGRKRQEWLEHAAEVYQQLADQLDATSSKAPEQADIALLREASFAVAECRQELAQFGEALRLNKLLLQRYAHQPESVQAFIKIYQCYFCMVGPDQAAAEKELRAALQTLLDQLPSIPADGLATLQRGGHENWRQWLLSIQAYLDNPERKTPSSVTPDAGAR
jgi:tetratricopeptide (TPR) repeat protein